MLTPDMPDALHVLAAENGLSEALTRELNGSHAADTVRRNCTFCGRERTRKDDNHGPACPYWDFFGGGETEVANP
ncbi:hypothetical protein AB0I61_17175 [Polymorphospora rubra]|uniref:hypothetical protein n=1 Tax=Polymorphospora rubra TaxID=338584 RepID=UPI0033C7A04B